MFKRVAIIAFMGSATISVCAQEAHKTRLVTVGVVLSTTGPAAAFGIPEHNTIELAADNDSPIRVKYIVLDDASDPTNARKDVERLISEDHVDAIIGSSTTPASLAMIDGAANGKTAMVSVASSGRVVEPMDAKRRWVFKASYNDNQLSDILVRQMERSGVKRSDLSASAMRTGRAGQPRWKRQLPQPESRL